MKKSLLITLISWVVFACQEEPQIIIYTDAKYPVAQRVDDLLGRMTLAEKVAQMRIFHARLGIKPDENSQLSLSDNVKERLENGIAGIKNPGEHLPPVAAAKLNNQLQKYIIGNNRLGIPALFVTEAYNGVDAAGSTRFGRPITMAASWDTTLVHKVWDVVGREARLRGMHMCHSPEADIARDPRFGRMSETFGEDTHLVSEMVVAAVSGVQGRYDGLGQGTHIGAVTKHFAGYGQVQGGTNFAAIAISPRVLADEILPPFQAAVQRGKSLGIMASHGDLNGIASHGNRALLTGLLRDQWGFEGYVVSDANDVGRLHYFMKVAETPEDAAIMGLHAGIDIDLYADDAYALLPELVKNNPKLIDDIDLAVRRVLRVKFVLGLFDNPYVDIEKTEKEVRNLKAQKLAREADLASIILLENRNNTLPLDSETPRKVALIGPLVDSAAYRALAKQGGKSQQFLMGEGYELTDKGHAVPNLNTAQAYQTALAKDLSIAKKVGLAILYLGGDEYTAKEGFYNNALGDRASIAPVGPQGKLAKAVKAMGIPVIVVLKHRRTLAINAIALHADAILDAWDLGEYGDQAIAQILYGVASPSGKLPVTVPRSVGQLPIHYSQRAINFKKGYLFMENGPLYPFGYGLSYGDFAYSPLQVSNTELTPNTTLKVTTAVTNNGKMGGKETVQLYVTDDIRSVMRPAKTLMGFQKIYLAPGATKKVSFTITPNMLEFTGLNMKKALEPGKYTVMVGGSSIKGVTTHFHLIVPAKK